MTDVRTDRQSQLLTIMTPRLGAEIGNNITLAVLVVNINFLLVLFLKLTLSNNT